MEQEEIQKTVREEMAKDLARKFLERMNALGFTVEEIGKILKEEGK